jgi:hypothetical protein
MVGLSRARFYQLIGSAFPFSVYSVSTRRPFFDEEAQRICLEVKRRNCGIDGKPILFYCKRGGSAPSIKRPSTAPKAKVETKYTEIVDAVRALGLVVNSSEVGAAIAKLFPTGINGIDQSEVIRKVFVSIQRQDSTDNLGR